MSEPVGVTSDFCDREWVLSLTLEDRKLVGRDIQQGNLGNGLWEVRSDLTDGKIGRVIFCVARNARLCTRAQAHEGGALG